MLQRSAPSSSPFRTQNVPVVLQRKCVHRRGAETRDLTCSITDCMREDDGGRGMENRFCFAGLDQMIHNHATWQQLACLPLHLVCIQRPRSSPSPLLCVFVWFSVLKLCVLRFVFSLNELTMRMVIREWLSQLIWAETFAQFSSHIFTDKSAMWAWFREDLMLQCFNMWFQAGAKFEKYTAYKIFPLHSYKDLYNKDCFLFP